jgi:hypothetical protein
VQCGIGRKIAFVEATEPRYSYGYDAGKLSAAMNELKLV